MTENEGPKAWLALAAKIVVDAEPDAHGPVKTTGARSVPLAQSLSTGQGAVPVCVSAEGPEPGVE